MEDLTVVYFCMEKEGCGKRWWRSKWQYRITETLILESLTQPENREASRDRIQPGSPITPIRHITVRLPPYGCRKKPWKEAELLSYLQGLAVPKEDGRVYYLYEKEAGRLLRRQPEELPVEWLLFMVEQCMTGWRMAEPHMTERCVTRQCLSGQHMTERCLSGQHMAEQCQPERNALVILQDREMDAARLVEKYVASIRYIGIVTANSEEWEGLQEALAEEYGFLLDVVKDICSLRLPAESKVLWVAGRELYGITPVRLTQDSIWLNTDLSNEEGKKICARGRNVFYVDVACLGEGGFQA